MGPTRPRRPPRVRVQLQGIQDRLEEVPVPPGNYADLSAGDGTLFWLSSENGERRTRKLEALEITNHEPEPTTLVEGVRSYELSADGKKILVRKGDDLYVFGAGPKPPSKLADDQVDLGDWTLQVDPRREYMEMFREAWRLHRDYFYDPGMHGVDWPAMEEKYLPLARRVTDREELSDVIGQMVAELSALHTFVVGGDMRPGQDTIQVASLGARLQRDPKAGGYRVEHIYRADPDLPDQLSPLARPGVEARDGDVLTAIDGVSTLSVPDYRALLRHKAGKQILLSIRPAAGGAERRAIVTPIGERQAADLRYDEWEYTRRLEVDSLSHDSIGYVHLRAMGSSDIAAWERQFYPVFDRQALIIDVRNNRGGNIDSWILEKLMRRAWMYFKARKEAPTLEHAGGLPRAHDRAHQRAHRIRRRGVQRGLSAAGAGQAARHPDVGRGDLAQLRQRARGWRHRLGGRDGRVRPEGAVAHRGSRGRSRHRGRQRAAPDLRGPRRAAPRRRAGAPEGDAGAPEPGAARAGLSRQERGRQWEEGGRLRPTGR